MGGVVGWSPRARHELVDVVEANVATVATRRARQHAVAQQRLDTGDGVTEPPGCFGGVDAGGVAAGQGKGVAHSDV
jgi:hypothetical protein